MLEITSPAFTDGDAIPQKYSRRGGDISPPLKFANIPETTKSLSIVCHDPDAPRDAGWTHWLVWNIMPHISGFSENTLPTDAIQGKTDWGENRWGGPQPPSGTHRYVFYLYALDFIPILPSSTDRDQLLAAIKSHVIEQATLTGLYNA